MQTREDHRACCYVWRVSVWEELILPTVRKWGKGNDQRTRGVEIL